MDTSASARPAWMVQLTAINVGKGVTLSLLIAFIFLFGVRDLRQVIYLCLHISYCLWWLLEQVFYPQRRQQLFQEATGWGGFVFTILVVGVFYTLPGYLAFTNPEPIGMVAVAVALPLYIFGSLINAIADVQKYTAKQYGASLVTDGIWRFSRHINYLADFLRYLSFSIIAGSAWGYLVPAFIAFLYFQSILQKEAAMLAKYENFADYQRTTARLIPFIW